MGKDLSELATYFLPQVVELLERLTEAGLEPVVEDTGRTFTEQEQKLNLGVSWTTKSKHLPQPPEMKSEAIDIVPRACMAEKFWGWTGEIETSHPHWARMIEIVESLGLKSGVHFPHSDPGHCEYSHPPGRHAAVTPLADSPFT
jgi:hypothetical protein